MLVFTIFCCIGIAFYALHKMSHKLKDLENSSKSTHQQKEKETFQKPSFITSNTDKPKQDVKKPEVIMTSKTQQTHNQNESKDYVEQGLNWILNKVNKK